MIKFKKMKSSTSIEEEERSFDINVLLKIDNIQRSKIKEDWLKYFS